jgi:hypothetical protein
MWSESTRGQHSTSSIKITKTGFDLKLLLIQFYIPTVIVQWVFFSINTVPMFRVSLYWQNLKIDTISLTKSSKHWNIYMYTYAKIPNLNVDKKNNINNDYLSLVGHANLRMGQTRIFFSSFSLLHLSYFCNNHEPSKYVTQNSTR